MKAFVISAILIVCGQQVYSQATCQNNCKDMMGTSICVLMNHKCGSLQMAIFCQKSCKVCTSCSGPSTSLKRTLGDACEIGPCTDIRGTVWCGIIKQTMKDGCTAFGDQCKSTCGLCKTCKLPPTELACTKDCEDSSETTCTYWKKKGYCDVKKGFPHTRIACPMSCGTCKLCPTEPPTTTTTKSTTTQSTTAQDCSTCEDKNQFCAHWKKEGYCDVTKGFPDTRKACPKTCDVCKPCSDLK